MKLSDVTRKTIFGLSTCYMAVFTMGNGFLPLMPIYAQSWERRGRARATISRSRSFAFLRGLSWGEGCPTSRGTGDSSLPPPAA